MSADGFDAPRITPTRDQARQAGKLAAMRNVKRDGCLAGGFRTDAYDALAAYVTEENLAGLEPHTMLADMFCDEYDAEYSDRQRQGWGG